MAMRLYLRGEKEMIEALAKVAPKTRDIVARALRQEAERIMAIAKQQHVPREHNDLANSGKVSAVARTMGPRGREWRVTLSFGDPKTFPYAIAVHEHWSPASPPTWQHPKKGYINFRRGGPKYLYKPMLKEGNGLPQRLANRIRTVLG